MSFVIFCKNDSFFLSVKIVLKPFFCLNVNLLQTAKEEYKQISESEWDLSDHCDDFNDVFTSFTAQCTISFSNLHYTKLDVSAFPLFLSGPK